MERVVAAFESETNLGRICDMLESGGVAVRHRFRSGGEVIRTVSTMGGGIVVCGFKLADMPASEMIANLEDSPALILMVAKPHLLDLCESGSVYKLPTPVMKSQLSAVVESLIQMDEKRMRAALPRRSPEEQALFEKAKALLMEKSHMAEDEAHRLIQRRSMNMGLRVAETSRRIIESLS